MVKLYKERYAERVKNGLCVRCGKRPPEAKATRCRWCKARYNAYWRAWKANRQAPKDVPNAG